jgi:hypothetical protein
MRGVAIVCAVCGCASEMEREEHQTVSLTVLASGMPIADVRVWFQAADGALLRDTRTDANGVAATFADDGASVTALVPYLVDGNPSPTLFTIAGARAGDALVIEGVAEDVPIRNVHFELPDTGENEYTVHASCLHQPFSGRSFTAVLVGCDEDEAFVIHAPAGELYVEPVHVSDGMTIDLRDRAFAPMPRVPIELTSFTAQHSATVGSELIYEHRQISLPDTLLDLSTGQASWMGFATPSVTLAVEAAMDDDFDLDVNSHLLVEWGPLESVQFDGSMLLPRRAPPTFDPDARTLAWSEPTGASFAHLVIQTQASANVPWDLIVPTDGFTITYPQLPPELGAYVPTRSDLSVAIDIALISSTVGYDGLRAQYFERQSHPLVAGPQGRTIVRMLAK